MTKEINDILAAFKEAQLHGRRTALATVVHVEGSSYRRPGARMLVEDNGRITGAISGGCLEGDALRKALLAINQEQNKLVTYNTLHEDEIEFGVQLGCNGIVHILFEPIDLQQKNNPIVLLEACCRNRKDAVMVTLFSLQRPNDPQPGTCFFFNEENIYSNIPEKYLEAEIKEAAATVLAGNNSLLMQCKSNALTAFVELLQPPVSLHIVGAGNDALPLVEMAAVLGWQIIVIDGRATHATSQRFPKANKIIVGKPVEAIQQLLVDERTAFVLMTHNYNYDIEMMQLLLQTPCRYIGALGPKKRMERMFNALQEQDLYISSEQKEKVYGPTGLDIGAETAEEIALSVMAEIKAAMSDRKGGLLRNRMEDIHVRTAPVAQ